MVTTYIWHQPILHELLTKWGMLLATHIQLQEASILAILETTWNTPTQTSQWGEEDVEQNKNQRR